MTLLKKLICTVVGCNWMRFGFLDQFDLSTIEGRQAAMVSHPYFKCSRCGRIRK